MIIHQNGRRIFIVGDIHGELHKLQVGLAALGFRYGEDVLVATGDLIDRGPHSMYILEGFRSGKEMYSVLGNHDDFMVAMLDYNNVDPKLRNPPNWAMSPEERIWMHNGGAWAKELSWNVLIDYATWLNTLPWYIELKLDCGDIFGVVHAETPLSWEDTKERVRLGDRKLQNHLIWGRTVVNNWRNNNLVCYTRGVEYLFVGHNVVDYPVIIGNQVLLDTGACFGDRPLSFAIIEPSGNFSLHSVGANGIAVCV